MSVPVSEAAVDLLELAAQYLRVATDAREFVWKYEYGKAASVWRSPSPAPVSVDRVVVTALRWQDDRHLYATRCAEASVDWGNAQAHCRDAEVYFADIKALLLPPDRPVSLDDWRAARVLLHDLECAADRVVDVRSSIFGV